MVKNEFIKFLIILSTSIVLTILYIIANFKFIEIKSIEMFHLSSILIALGYLIDSIITKIKR